MPAFAASLRSLPGVVLLTDVEVGVDSARVGLEVPEGVGSVVVVSLSAEEEDEEERDDTAVGR
jgi:hypothetical protein